jgi:hypothetical protein
MRHRIFWDLQSSDTFQSLCLDRQPLMQTHMSEVPFPRNCDDSDLTETDITPRAIDEPTTMTLHVFRAPLFKTLNRLYADNGRAWTSYESVSAIDDELSVIMDQYPWYLRLTDPASDSSSTYVSTTLPVCYDFVQWQHHILHNSISVQRLRMYRPFLRSERHHACWPKCIAAIESTFAVYHSIRAADPAKFQRSQKFLAQSYQLFCSAVSVAVFLLVERPLLPSRMQTDIEVVIQDLKCLVDGNSSIPMAVDGQATLTKILAAYRNTYSRSVADHGDRDGDRAERAPSASTIADSVSKSDLHALVPEIYTIMGGESKTKTYLDRCALSHIVHQDVAAAAASSPQPTLETRGPSENHQLSTLTPADTYGTPHSNPPIYPAIMEEAFPYDPTIPLNLNVHFDVLNWDVEDFAFLET